MIVIQFLYNLTSFTLLKKISNFVLKKKCGHSTHIFKTKPNLTKLNQTKLNSSLLNQNMNNYRHNLVSPKPFL
jgi:hypothetical protein